MIIHSEINKGDKLIYMAGVNCEVEVVDVTCLYFTVKDPDGTLHDVYPYDRDLYCRAELKA